MVLALDAEKADRTDLNDLVDEVDLKDLLLVKVLSLIKLLFLFLLETDDVLQLAEFLDDAYFIPPFGPIILLDGFKL